MISPHKYRENRLEIMVVTHMMPLYPSQDAYFGRCPHSRGVALTGTPLRLPTVSISQEICTRFLLCCALLWLYTGWFFPYPSGLLHWHCGNLTIAPVPAKQPWWIWINTSCEFIMNDCITTTKQSTTKPCAYFLGYTVSPVGSLWFITGGI